MSPILPVTLTEAPPSSGLCLGGIGSGGIELWPDGVFRHPGFLNTRPLCNGAHDADSPPEPEFGVEDLFFLLWVKRAERPPQLRWLFVGQGNAFMTWGHMSRTYKYASVPTVRRIAYRAAFPSAELVYEDERLPVEVKLRAWSPFVPHELAASAVPGLLFDFEVVSRVDEPVEVSIVTSATNLAGWGQAGASQAHTRRAERGFFASVMKGGAQGLATSGETALFAAPRDGQRATALAGNPHIENLFLSLHETGGLEGKLLPERLRHEEHRESPGAGAMERNRGWVSVGERLAPRGATRLRLGWSWFFPNHRDRQGAEAGKYYENHYSGAEAVARALAGRGDEWDARSRRWPDLVGASSLPPALAAALLDQAATLVKGSWLTRAGDFFLWEGVGEGGLNTVDVDHYGSYGLALLFPELRAKVLDLIAAGQRTEGRMPHAFAQGVDPKNIPDFEYHRWDVNCQFVLALHRDWRATGDASLLERHHAAAGRALDFVTARLHPEAGLPWVEGGITYDHWHMVGVTAYLAGVWLAALQAQAEMAEAMGTAGEAARLRGLWERGRGGFERCLWAGDRYRPVWRGERAAAAPEAAGAARATDVYAERYRVNAGGDRMPVDDGLHTDALNGEAVALLNHLPGAARPDRVRTHLRRVVAENTHADARFLANGSCPGGAFPDEWPFSQWQNPWTGTEYFVAAHLIAAGLVGEGLRIIEDVHERLTAETMRWNHVECGGHYSRALSIYAAYQAWTGIDHDARRGWLTVRPVEAGRALRLPMLTARLLGEIEWTPGNEERGAELRLQVFQGEASLMGLELPEQILSPTVEIWDGARIRLGLKKVGAELVLAEPLVLKSGSLVVIRCVIMRSGSVKA